MLEICGTSFNWVSNQFKSQYLTLYDSKYYTQKKKNIKEKLLGYSFNLSYRKISQKKVLKVLTVAW